MADDRGEVGYKGCAGWDCRRWWVCLGFVAVRDRLGESRLREKKREKGGESKGDVDQGQGQERLVLEVDSLIRDLSGLIRDRKGWGGKREAGRGAFGGV